MANYNITTATGAASAAQLINTDKVRVASTTDIYFTSGNSSIVCTNADPIILAGAPERSVYVGAGNYVSVLAVSTAGKCSVTEVGASGVL